MPRIRPLDDLPRLYRLQIFHPEFPDYPIYSPPMTATVVRQERARLLDAGRNVIVQSIMPDVAVLGNIPLQDFG